MVVAGSVVFVRDVILSAHLQPGGEMFHFLWHRISITLSRSFKGHLDGQVGGVITVTLPSIGQLASGLIDGQQWPRVASTSQIDEWFIFFTRTDTTHLFGKWEGLYHWTHVK